MSLQHLELAQACSDGSNNSKRWPQISPHTAMIDGSQQLPKTKHTSNKLKLLLPNPSMTLDLANDIQVVVGFKRIFPLSLSLCLMTLNPNSLSKDVPQEPKTDSSNCTTCGGTHMNENSLNIARISRTTSQDAKGMLDQILSSSLKECLCVSIYEIVAHASLHSARASSNL